MDATPLLRAALLEHFRGLVASVGLMSGEKEIQGNSYERVPVRFGEPNGKGLTNSSEVLFPMAAPNGWGKVTHAAYFDAVGSLLMRTKLENPKQFDATDQPIFHPGQLEVDLI